MSNNYNLEQIKKTKPIFYNQIKKGLEVEKLYLKLNEEILSLKEQRKELSKHYYKITKAFTVEDKVKQRVKESEAVVEERGKIVDALTKELSELQQKIHVTKVNIQNVEVKKLLFEYNEVKGMKERLLEKKQRVAEEIIHVQETIEKLTKNPGKVTPSSANTNLRKEIQQLETRIMEASKEVREKEKESFQAQFNYEESKKTLQELQRPQIVPVVTRGPGSKRVTINEAVSPSKFSGESPASPTKFSEKRSSIKGESIEKISDIRSSIKAESPTSPEKRISILNMMSGGMTETLTEKLARALKGVGNPGQGIASKLLSVNRGEFIGKLSSK